MTTTTTEVTTFTQIEKRALRSMRSRYQKDPDLFSSRERDQLRFMRWLYQTGRLSS